MQRIQNSTIRKQTIKYGQNMWTDTSQKKIAEWQINKKLYKIKLYTLIINSCYRSIILQKAVEEMQI